MKQDTRTLEERYLDMRAERDELEQKIFTVATLLVAHQKQEHKACAASDCEAFPAYGATKLPLCSRHLMVAHGDWERYEALTPYESPAEYYDLKAAREARAEAEAKARKLHPAVYYVRMNERVKIGTTTNLALRLRSFHALPEQLLAIEPGDYVREHKRHAQFGHLRVGKSELFDLDEKLQQHIDLVRQTFGDPIRFLAAA